MRPKEGFTPTTPQYEAGFRIESPVSVPSAALTSLDATKAALPPLDPPDTRFVSKGFNTGPL